MTGEESVSDLNIVATIMKAVIVCRAIICVKARYTQIYDKEDIIWFSNGVAHSGPTIRYNTFEVMESWQYYLHDR